MLIKMGDIGDVELESAVKPADTSKKDLRESAEKMIRRSISTERGYLSYRYYLGITLEDLEGKTVLDLGSGRGQIFAANLKDSGINANIISLDPKVAMPGLGKGRGYIDPRLRGDVIGALGQNLPFIDNSFDYVYRFMAYLSICGMKAKLDHI